MSLQAVRRCLTGAIKKDLEQQLVAPTPKAGPSKPKKRKELYTIRDVVKVLHRPLIDNEIPCTSKDPDYIGHYQRAVTTICNNMSEEEAQEVKGIVEQWNKEGAPPEVQLR
jgi:hypothetical protein